MKYIILAVLLASVCCVIVPINGQEKSSKETTNGQGTNNATSPQGSPSPSPRIAQGRPEQDNSEQQSEGASNQPKGYFSRLFAPENLPNLLLCAIGIAGVIAAVYTLGKVDAQATEMRIQNSQLKESVALAKDTAERQLRAYICVEAATLKFPHPEVPEAQIHFKNYGQTPAYDVRGWIHTWFAEYPLTEILPSAPDDFRRSSDILGPGRHSIFVAPRKPALSPDAVHILGTVKLTLYVYGEIRYRDAFKQERTTKFRLIHGGVEGVRRFPEKDGEERWSLKPDTEGNEAD